MSNRMHRTAASLMGISALFHLAAPFVSDFSRESLTLLLFFVLYVLFAWLVLKGRRWAAWISFFLMLFGGIAGMAGYVNPSTVPAWVSLGIWVSDWLAALCLFIILWKDKVSFQQEARQAPEIEV